MIIIHKQLPEEANHIAKTINTIYGFESISKEGDLKSLFAPIPEFKGFKQSYQEIYEYFKDILDKDRILILTQRDLYKDNISQDDDWVFGYSYKNLAVVATSRIKRYDNKQSEILEVPEDLYRKRLAYLSIHEIGHEVIHSNHFKHATWINTNKKYELPLGRHCTDNKCVLYEIVDINAPSLEEGYMQLGREKRYDAGLDNVLKRIYPDWFCEQCKSSLQTKKHEYFFTPRET